MPGYIEKLLKKFQHVFKHTQYSPFPVAPYRKPERGKQQFAPPEDLSPLLTKDGTTRVQQIVRSPCITDGRWTVQYSLLLIPSYILKPIQQKIPTNNATDFLIMWQHSPMSKSASMQAIWSFILIPTPYISSHQRPKAELPAITSLVTIHHPPPTSTGLFL